MYLRVALSGGTTTTERRICGYDGSGLGTATRLVGVVGVVVVVVVPRGGGGARDGVPKRGRAARVRRDGDGPLVRRCAVGARDGADAIAREREGRCGDARQRRAPRLGPRGVDRRGRRRRDGRVARLVRRRRQAGDARGEQQPRPPRLRDDGRRVRHSQRAARLLRRGGSRRGDHHRRRPRRRAVGRRRRRRVRVLHAGGRRQPVARPARRQRARRAPRDRAPGAQVRARDARQRRSRHRLPVGRLRRRRHALGRRAVLAHGVCGARR
mmetsp:Transcript_14795/g.59238  ORF Transcript_14795/g.59238 Transcript_14795/m.59238 type:complete len:268 (+) Transcript_14795:99-902(+)